MITPTQSIKHIKSDTGDLIKALEKLKSHHVKNGVLSGTGVHPNSKSATVAMIAAWNEFGTPTIPSRPFMRLAYDAFGENKKFLLAMLRSFVCKSGGGVRKNPRVDAFFQIMGLKIQSLMDFYISSNIAPENAESTKARKNSLVRADKTGNPQTLIDTGILRKSLSYEVIKN